jgi:hypothetical protein
MRGMSGQMAGRLWSMLIELMYFVVTNQLKFKMTKIS